jgi:hypothetical protein
VPVEGRRVGVIVSGGNVDLVQAGAWFAAGDGVSGGQVDQAWDPGPAGGLRR